MDPVKVWRDELRALLPADEQLLAAAACQKAFGADRLERSPEEMERLLRFLPGPTRDRALAALRAEPVPEKAWERVLGVLVGADSIIRSDVDKVLGGVAATGHVGSCAARFAAAFGARTGVHCVVTDRRLLLAERHLNPVRFDPRVEVPRRAVLHAHREGRFLQRGRVVIDFVDLSRIALMTGMIFTGRADAIVAALTPSSA